MVVDSVREERKKRKKYQKMEQPKKKTWVDYYERIVDNVLRVLWLILLVTWIVTEHKL